MKKVFLFLTLILFLLLSGCRFIIEGAIDSVYQNMEIDHFEETTNESIQLFVGIEEVPDFKEYVNRVSPEGIVKAKDRFQIDMEDFDINQVGTYTIKYTFTSLEEAVNHQILVEVIKRPKEEIVELSDYSATLSSINATLTLLNSDYSIEATKIELYEETDSVVDTINDVINLSNIEFTDLIPNTTYWIKIYFEDGSTYDFTDLKTLSE